MKIAMNLLFMIGLISLSASAQETSTSGLSSIYRKIKDSNFKFDFDLTTETVRNKENEISGTDSYFDINTGYDFTKDTDINLRQELVFERRDEEKAPKDLDRTAWDTTELHLNHRVLRESANGMDLKLSARYIYQVDNKVRRKYGSYGTTQLRAYWGRSLFGRFIIDRYNTYARVEKYDIREESNSKKSRDRGYRFRITPAYEINDDLKVGLTATWTRYDLNNDDPADKKDEDISISPSIRFAFNNMAVILYTLAEPYKTNKDGKLALNDTYLDEIAYGMNFAVYVF